MPLTNYEYKDGDSFPHSIAEGYKEAEKYWGIPGAACGAGQYAIHNKVKTSAIAFVTLPLVALTTAYFFIPAYATFVGTVGTKAAALVSPAITAMSAFAVAHPLIASLIVVAAVAALITAPVLVYKNNSKASQVDAVKEVFNKCEKDGDKLAMNDGKVKVKDDDDALTLLTEVATAAGVIQQPTQQNR